MDRQLSSQEQSTNKLKKWLPAFIILGLMLLGYQGMQTLFKKSGKSKDFHIVTVGKGTIKETLSAAGTVIAAAERVINAPVSTEIEAVLLSTGSDVKKGDLILQLDKEYTRLEYERLADELSLRKNNINKLTLEYDKDLRDLDYRDQIKALQLNELKADLTDLKSLVTIGGATEQELEASQLQLSIAEIEKKMLENELQYMRAVNSTDKKNLQLEYNIQNKRLTELNRKLKETQVRAPEAGVITWINEDIGKTVTVGEPLVKIANLDKYKIEATTSDRNSKDLAIGMPVDIRIGKERLKGTVSRVLPEIVNNTIRFFVSLDSPDHLSLRPNLRTELYIVKAQKDNVLRAKRGNALKGTTTQFIYKMEGQEAVKTRITKGLSSNDYFEIKEGLKEGDKIVISDTEDYNHMERFTITKK